MSSSNAGDFQTVHTTINSDIFNKAHDKEELCKCLKSTKLNFGESLYIFQQIKSKYEIIDRLDIIRNLSIDFGEIKNFEISKIFDLLKIFGKCIEWDAFNTMVEIIESGFSRIQQRNNKNIEILKAVRNFNFDSIYDIFNKMAEENDAETISIAIKEKMYKTKNEYGQDIFSYSLEKPNINLIRFMIEFGFDYTQHLSTIFNNLNTKTATYFFKILHFDINRINDYNQTALTCASRKGHRDVVKILLTIPGINVNAKDGDNYTALIWASLDGHHEVVKLLLTVPGIDVNAKDKYNKTALICASEFGRHEIIKLLLTVPGIDVNAKDKYNKTALTLASYYRKDEIVKLLLTVPGIDTTIVPGLYIN